MTPLSKFASGLRYFLTGLYFLSGAAKIVPFSSAIKNELEKGFALYATVFPAIPLGLHPNPYLYQMAVGVGEVALAAGFLLGPRKCQLYCCGGLMVIMVGAIQTTLCLQLYDQCTMASLCLIGLAYVFSFLYPFVEDKKKSP